MDPTDPRSAALAYLSDVRTTLDGVDADAIERFVGFLRAIDAAGGTVHAVGDGGSAALAEHLACDLAKIRGLGRGPDVRSLVENPALLTMLANDHGFEEVFARQVVTSVRAGDGLLLISGSGRSPNLLRAAEEARARAIRSFALLGFGDGGPLASLVDDALVVRSDDYRVIEDVHHSVGHAAAAALAVATAPRAMAVVIPREVVFTEGPDAGAGGWRPGAREALARLRGAGWKVAVIDDGTSGGAGPVDGDGTIDLVVECTHGTGASCRCRRPATGLLDRAAAGLGLRPHDCVVIGGAPADAVLGQRAGARTILIGQAPSGDEGGGIDLGAAVAALLRTTR
ncbi:MAG: SIS domain-containing protein [Chloroflexi bacterium]|nr:SIS domain-containing protein [Chloroflexota bacterium]